MSANKTFKMADVDVLPGTKKVVLFPAPNIHMQVKVDIPVHVFQGKKSGPAMFVLGAIHGDEFNGIEIIRRLHECIDVSLLHGTLITVPVVNIHGVMMRSRYFSDRRDLNRSFPGKDKGSLAARLAHGVMKQVVKRCDYGIDLHTGAVGRINMPQLRVDFSTPNAKEFALSFNAPVILDSKQRDGSLREAASKLGIPVIVYEGGEALRFNELCIRAGLNGILNTMRFLKMYAFNHAHEHQSKSVITSTSRWVRAPVSGLVEPVGDTIAEHVKKGQIVAHVHDPFLLNPSIPVRAPFEGVVIGQSLQAMVTEGDALYHIASFKKIAGVKAYIEEFKEEIS